MCDVIARPSPHVPLAPGMTVEWVSEHVRRMIGGPGQETKEDFQNLFIVGPSLKILP